METLVPETAPNGAVTRQTPKVLIRREPIILEPTKSWVPVRLSDIWDYRELLYFMMWRDLKVRYKQTMMGAAWVILQPLVITLVFTVFLGRLAQIPSAGIPYPLLVFSGLIPWMYFSSAVLSSGNSLVANAHLITKVYFPRLIVPLAAVGARLVDFAISSAILGGLLYYYRIPLTWKIATVPLFVVVMTALALGVGTLTSAWNVKYRDVGLILPVVLQLWMFASPIVYPVEIVPAGWRQLYALNPMVGLISGFRSVLLNREFDWTALIISAITTVLVLVYALYSFRRMEKNFADIV